MVLVTLENNAVLEVAALPAASKPKRKLKVPADTFIKEGSEVNKKESTYNNDKEVDSLLIKNHELKLELLDGIKLLLEQLKTISDNQISTNNNLKLLSNLIMSYQKVQEECIINDRSELEDSKIKQSVLYILINLVIVSVMSLAILHLGTMLGYTMTAKLIQYVVGLSLFYAYGYILYSVNNYKEIINKLFKQR